MSTILFWLTPVLFLGAVGGLTWFLMKNTQRDEERWMADRRGRNRRSGLPRDAQAYVPDRRLDERRHEAELEVVAPTSLTPAKSERARARK